MGRKATSYLLGKLFVVLAATALAASFVCNYAPQAPLSYGWLIVGMVAPLVFGANLLLLLWCLVRRRWFVLLLPLAALIVGAGDMLGLMQPPRWSDPAEGDLRIATFNVHGFQQEHSHDYMAHRIAGMLRGERIDVALLQEALDNREHPFDSLAMHFTKTMPHYVRELSMACFSRYPILDHEYVRFPESNQSYLRVDVEVDGHPVRFISVHLQTTGISMAQRHFRKTYGVRIPIDTLCRMLYENAVVRMEQVAAVRQVIETSPMPVVVAGDFNDIPLSKTYHVLSAGLTDAFRTAGHGFGGSYRGLVRIDYVLHDEAFEAVDYYVWRQEVLSDHKPVIASLRFAQ